MIVNYVVRNGRRIEVNVLDTGHKRRERKSFQYRWVKAPRHWITGLARTKSTATYRLAFIILIEAFKRKHLGGQIILSATVTGHMSRATKMRAIMELADFGLIQIKSVGKKATVVSIAR
jgi:hypothetical protein